MPFGEASPGATGLELLLSLALKWADEHLSGKDKLSIALARITCDAARVAGLSAGGLSIGSQADVCIFDPAIRWQVNDSAIVSQGKHTPFLGYELSGQVRYTIVSGRLAYTR